MEARNSEQSLEIVEVVEAGISCPINPISKAERLRDGLKILAFGSSLVGTNWIFAGLIEKLMERFNHRLIPPKEELGAVVLTGISFYTVMKIREAYINFKRELSS